MTTAQQVKNTADRAAKTIHDLQEKATQLANNPDSIDSWVLKFLVYGLVIVPIHFFWENRAPYTLFLASMLGMNIIVRLAGFLMVSLVQYLEIRPFILRKETPNAIRKRVSYTATAAYVCDVAVCSAAWPIFATQYGMPMLDDILWVNVGKIVAIVCGFSLWFALRRVVQRKA